MRIVVIAPLNAGDVPVGGIAHDLRFDRIKVDRTAPLASSAKCLVKRIQGLQVFLRAAALGVVGGVSGERCPHRGIGLAGVRVNERRIELIGRHFALGIDHHIAHHGAAINARIKRAKAVRELLRQHRHDAAGKIDTRQAPLGILI